MNYCWLTRVAMRRSTAVADYQTICPATTASPTLPVNGGTAFPRILLLTYEIERGVSYLYP